jgi:hypothetical protein
MNDEYSMKIRYKELYGDIYLGNELSLERQKEILLQLQPHCYLKRYHHEYYMSTPVRLYCDGIIKDDEKQYRFIDVMPLSQCSIAVYHNFVSYVPVIENYTVVQEVQDMECDVCLYIIEPLVPL